MRSKSGSRNSCSEPRRGFRTLASPYARPYGCDPTCETRVGGVLRRKKLRRCRGLAPPPVDVNVTPRAPRLPHPVLDERRARVPRARAQGPRREWIDLDPADRSPVEALSGQSLVPVLLDGGRVVSDSTAILHYLEDLQPEPALFPSDEARRAGSMFSSTGSTGSGRGRRTRSRPSGPSRIRTVADRRARPRADRIARRLRADARGPGLPLRRVLGGRLRRFPFLKYGVLYDEADTEEFHVILREHLALDGRYPRRGVDPPRGCPPRA